MHEKFEMSPIPSGTKRGWKILLNGQEIDGVEKLELSHPEYGRVIYGMYGKDETFDSWAFEAINGSFLIPYCWINRKLFVGLLWEKRPNMGDIEEFTLCVVGGGVEPDETYHEAIIREAEEEASLGRFKSFILPGKAVVVDRFRSIANVSRGEGLHFFACEVPLENLSKLDETHYKIVGLPESEEKNTGKVGNVEFMPWWLAIENTADTIALAAIARLLACLW